MNMKKITIKKKVIASGLKIVVKNIGDYLDYFNIVLIRDKAQLDDNDVKDLKSIEDHLSQIYKILRNITLRH